MKRLALITCSVLLPIALAGAAYIWVSGAVWRAYVVRAAPMYASEAGVRAEGARNMHDSAVGALPMKEPVAVMWDTYGKDYWACYVRTSTGARGWISCTNLSAPVNGASDT